MEWNGMESGYACRLGWEDGHGASEDGDKSWRYESLNEVRTVSEFS